MSRARKSSTDRPLRIHQAIARDVGVAILSGEFAPGDRIGVEIEQAEAHEVSRTAYREAVRILVAKGLLESRPKIGTHVTPRERWNLLDPDILAWMFAGSPDEKFIRDLFELRGLIEPGAAAVAAERRTNVQLDQMVAALADMRRHGLATPDGQAADKQFHRTILAATHNAMLVSLASSIGAAVQWTTRYKQEASEAPRDPLPEHEAVLEAIAAADPARSAAAMEHLLRLALADMQIKGKARTGTSA